MLITPRRLKGITVVLAALGSLSVRAQQPSPPAPAGPTFHAPVPDIRVAVALPPLQVALARLKNLQYHGLIMLEGYGCGPRSEYLLELREAPLLDAAYSFNPANGDYAASISSTVESRFSIHCGAILINNGYFDIHTELKTTVGSVPVSGFSIPYTSKITNSGLFNQLLTDHFLHDDSIHVNLPFDQPGVIPLCIEPQQRVTLTFQSPDAVTDATGRTCRPLPYQVHIGGVDSPAGKTLLLDLFVDSPKVVPMATQAEAMKLFAGNMPLFEQKSAIGLSVATSFFGEYANNGQTASGLLKHFLPLRVKTTVNGRFLFWKYSKTIEALLDEGHVDFASDGTALLTLSSHWLSVNGGSPIVSAHSPIKQVTGRVAIDRLRSDGGSFAFRIADFKLRLKTTPFVMPITLSSGNLEGALNHGRIDLTGIAAIGGRHRCVFIWMTNCS
jgi:hypothetical protein